MSEREARSADATTSHEEIRRWSGERGRAQTRGLIA
jgi:hypothetical protein